jgi:drug/metabolite transporter (DMT)-like permease
LHKASTLAAPTLEARRSSRHSQMHGLMLVATFCWAGNMVALKDALAGFNPLALALLRVAGAAIVYLTLFLLIRRKLPRRLTAREWWVLSLVAMSGVTFNQLFFVGGIARSTVAHAGLIVALGPIMVLVLSCLMRLEALTIPKFVGMLISFAGVAVLTIGKAGRLNGGHLVGDLILLAGSAVFAYYTILVKEVADRYDPLTLNALAYAIGVILILPFTVGSLADVQWQRVPLYSWWGVGFAILLGSVVPYLVFAYVMSELTAARVAAFAYIQPVIATGLGIWLLREHLTVKVVVGGILILAGVYLTERERGEERAIE